MMNRYPAIVTSLLAGLVLAIGCSDPERTVAEPVETTLDYGEFAVGFRSLYVADLARPPVPFSDWDGRMYPETMQEEGRSLPIHLWYPAASSGETIIYADYVDRLTTQTEPVRGTRDTFAQEILLSQVRSLAGDTSFSTGQLDTLLDLRQYATLQAPPAAGTFPLVVFPNGSAPASQSILCEYLASHGYVVAGVALKGAHAHAIDANVRGLEVAVDDLEFVLHQLLELPNVDGDHIALLANAIESSFCVGLVSRNGTIDAVVSLEGGLLSQFEQNILDETVFYAPQNVNVPILAIYAPHPNISPVHIAHLDYSDRYLAHFPGMSEFHFLNYGVFEAYVPGIIGETDHDTRQGFRAGSELILAFLEAKLRDRTEPLDNVFGNATPGTIAAVVDTLFIMPGRPAPPNITVMKDLFLRKGMAAIDSIYQAHRSQGDPQPFGMDFFADVRSWLAWKKDPDYVHRKRLYEIGVESYPGSALHRYFLGAYSDRTGDPVAARTHFTAAAALLASDETLDASFRQELEEAITARLE